MPTPWRLSPCRPAAFVHNPATAFLRPLPTHLPSPHPAVRRHPFGFPTASPKSSSSSQWKQRQTADPFAKSARTTGLKSRAAFKLVSLDESFRIFRRGQTVVDLGYAPGSWSQIAVQRTGSEGCVVGIDLLPASPPVGMARAIQGDFLAVGTREMMKRGLRVMRGEREGRSLEARLGEMERARREEEGVVEGDGREDGGKEKDSSEEKDEGRMVDVVLSDMMMNTTGNRFKDHIDSMQLCLAALEFANDTLKQGGHFVCKFYVGSDDKKVEEKLKSMFDKVSRVKPDSSRKESREAYWVARNRKGHMAPEDFTI